MLRSYRLPALFAGVALVVVAVLQAGAVAPGDPAFQRTWERTDQPVASGAVSRTWIWGPEANTAALQEDYAESPGGQRLVQYYDKSRMEINNPAGDPNTPFYVTNGLLVVELMTGMLQKGDNAFESHNPAEVNVAGDPDDPLTYADLAPLRTAPALPHGSTIIQRIDGNGGVSTDANLATHAVTAAFRLSVPGIDHQVASPFWAFLNSTGPVRINGQQVTERLFDPWFYATGYPITEAYWANVKVAGTVRLVLLQCFERRCLTYTPGNPAGFETEAGNVGQHYWTWRYVQIPGEATPTNTATATETTGPGTPTATPTNTNTPTATATNTATATATEEPATEYSYVTQWGKPYDTDSPFGAPIAAATDSDGNVYVLEAAKHRVQKYDSNGVYITGWGSEGSGNSQFNTPLGIAVDAEGFVYVADTLNHRIQRFGAFGTYLSQWPTTDPVSVTTLEPQGIAVGPTGLLYVTTVNASTALVQVYDHVGGFVTQFGSLGTNPAQFSAPRGVAFDSQGRVFVTDTGKNTVQRFTGAGVFEVEWGGTGSGDHQFMLPLGIAVDADDTVYVADAGNARVMAFTTGGGYVGPLVHPFKNFFPVAGAVDDDDNLYVVDNDHGVLKFNAAREFQFSWNDQRRGGFGWPRGIAVAADGTILVNDHGGDVITLSRVVRFTDDGTYLTEWGSFGSGPGQFNEASDTAINSFGQIYVLDRGNYRIQRFSPDGSYISQWGSQGSGDGQFTSLAGIAFDAGDNAYVTDRSAKRVQKFDAAGNYLGQWGAAGTGDGQFGSPEGIAVYDTTVYVVDNDNDRIQAFDLDGNYLFQWGTSGTGAGQFDVPIGIAVDAHGYVYVSDIGIDRVQKFTPDGEFLAMWGTKGSGNGQFDDPYSLTIDDAGNVYVLDSYNYRVQKFAPER